MKAVRLLILLGLLLVPFIVCADLGQKAVRGVVEVKKFLFDSILKKEYSGLAVTFIPGTTPVLILFDASGKEIERILLEKYDFDQLHTLVQSKGFTRVGQAATNTTQSAAAAAPAPQPIPLAGQQNAAGTTNWAEKLTPQKQQKQQQHHSLVASGGKGTAASSKASDSLDGSNGAAAGSKGPHGRRKRMRRQRRQRKHGADGSSSAADGELGPHGRPRIRRRRIRPRGDRQQQGGAASDIYT
eukprot:jgi/Chrzof1/2836/Cz12g00180.t1